MPPAQPPKDPVDRFRKALDRGGVQGLEKAIQRVEKQATAAQKPFEKLASTLDDPRLRRAAASALAVEDATRKLNSQARERLDLEARRRSVISGGYAAELRANQLITKERERVEAMERRAQLGAKYGRFGGFLYGLERVRNDPLARAAMTLATGVGGAATAAAFRGFSGTVEWNRLQLELTLVSRELAGAMLPAIQFVTRALNSLRLLLESLTPRQQNLVMLGGLAFGGLAATALARIGLAGIGGTAAGMLLGGTPVAAAAGGASAGVAARAAGLARFGGAAFQAYEGYRGVQDISSEESQLRGLGRQAVTSFEKITGQDFIARNVFGLKRGSAAGQAFDAVFGTNENNPRNRPTASGRREDRRKVTLADAGLEEPGSARERLTTSLALVDAVKAGAQIEKPVDQQILDFLKETFGDKTPERPAFN